MTLIAEDLLLLLLDDDKGTLAHSDKIQPLLGGALLIELAMAERIEVAEKTSRWSTSKVAALDGAPVTEPMLVTALAQVSEKPRSAQDLVNRIGKGTKEVLLDRLVQRGLVERVDGKWLGLFPNPKWPAADREHEAAVRASIQGALVQRLTPDARTSALISLLHAVDHTLKIVERGDVAKKEIRARAKEISDGAWAATAVKDAVMAAQAAMTAAVAASTTAAVASGS